MAKGGNDRVQLVDGNRGSCGETRVTESKALRLGLVAKGPRGFDIIKCHHLPCFPLPSFHSLPSPENAIHGFSSLKEAVDKATLSRGTNTHVAGNQVISARTCPNLVRLLDFDI